MLFIIVFVLFNFIALAHLQIEPKIVGGDAVQDLSSVAYQVSLQQNSNHFCGGSIISKDHVLTAAHCFNGDRNTKNIKVVVGILNLDQSHTKRHDVKIIFKHERYNSNTMEYDIAIVKLKKSLQLSDTIKPVELQNSTIDSSSCLISGWGYTVTNGSISNRLLSTEVNIVPYDECRKRLPLRDGMICAGVDEGGKDACQGDSGGPLVCNNLLTGIVSWGVGCGEKYLPGVYTDVAYYYSWINETMTKSASRVFHQNTITFTLILNICLIISQIPFL